MTCCCRSPRGRSSAPPRSRSRSRWASSARRAFVARLDSPTMPVAIVRLLSQPGAASVGQATAMSVVLMAVTAAITVAIDRFRVGAFGRHLTVGLPCPGRSSGDGRGGRRHLHDRRLLRGVADRELGAGRHEHGMPLAHARAALARPGPRPRRRAPTRSRRSPVSAMGPMPCAPCRQIELAPDALGLEQHLGARRLVVEPHEVSHVAGLHRRSAYRRRDRTTTARQRDAPIAAGPIETHDEGATPRDHLRLLERVPGRRQGRAADRARVPGTRSPGPGSARPGSRRRTPTRSTPASGASPCSSRARDRDRFAAGAVLLVGVGPKEDVTIDGMRRALGRAAATARRFGTRRDDVPAGLRCPPGGRRRAGRGRGTGARRLPLRSLPHEA